MARRAPKKQARRNGGGGTPGWVWLLVGLLVGALAVAVFLLRDQWDAPRGDLPTPNPEARAPATTEEEPVAQKPAAEPRKPKYEFFDVLRDKEFVIPDAELNAQAQAEASRPVDAAVPANADAVRYLIQAGAFRSSADAEALKARIALTGEVARVESAEIAGGTIYRVRLGPYPNAGSLARAKQALGSHGIDAVAIRAQ